MNKSCLFLSAVLLLTGAPAYAGQAPFAADAPNFPVSGRDRVYAAEQFSNTVSVIDRLSRLPFNQQKSRCHSPRRSSADELVAAVQEPSSRSRARLLAGSQDTRGRIDRFKFGDLHRHGHQQSPTYVGRSSHEAFFTQDGREV